MISTAVIINRIIFPAGSAMFIMPPGEPPVSGNFVPAAAAILTGLPITPELLLNDSHSRREKLILIWIAQLILRLRLPFGVIALLSGIFHLIAWDMTGF